MKTQNATYVPDLDVIRAIAALAVFFWHYLHIRGLYAESDYIPGIAFFEEGHVGVSLFMVLSGYLFFRITYRKEIEWRTFALNRVKRILPLLLIVQAFWLLAGVYGLIEYTPWDFIKGFVVPSWPSVTWSIAVELHFYLLLPALLWVAHRGPQYFLALVLGYFLLQGFVFSSLPPMTRYYTIIGRLDQFMLGAACFLYWEKLPKKIGAAAFIVFLAYLEVFNAGGGDAAFNSGSNSYFAPGFMRYSVEGVGLAGLMVWIVKADWGLKRSRAWSALAWIGAVSYSFYMIHYFMVRGLVAAMDRTGLGEAERLAIAPIILGLTLLASWACYAVIEKPFLMQRAKYVSGGA